MKIAPVTSGGWNIAVAASTGSACRRAAGGAAMPRATGPVGPDSGGSRVTRAVATARCGLRPMYLCFSSFTWRATPREALRTTSADVAVLCRRSAGRLIRLVAGGPRVSLAATSLRLPEEGVLVPVPSVSRLVPTFAPFPWSDRFGSAT